MRIKFDNRFFLCVVIGLIILRAILNGAVPLLDKTEARYAEIARIMAETQYWVVPHIEYHMPFWAKPPLSTWLSAVSFTTLGVNEFTARLPYLLMTVILAVWLGRYARKENLPFFLPGFILLTIPEVFLHAGVVSTDTALAFCTCIVMLSFWEAMQPGSRKIWGYLIFVGLGLGLLAKGPIIGILTIPPIVVWVFVFGNVKEVWQRIPIFHGFLITALIAVPWYYLAKIHSPGFIDYFILGEHFKRFFDSNWQGDKYGFPKTQPLGIIWLFLQLFALPWIQVVFFKSFKNIRNNGRKLFTNQWVLFLLLWLIWTPLFFTVSKSLIHPYIMPVMVPVVLLLVHYWKEIKKKTTLIKLALVFPLLVLVLFISLQFSDNFKSQVYRNTDKYLLENCDRDYDLYYFGEKTYSSQFYSGGKVQEINVKQLIEQDQPYYILIPNKREAEIPGNIKAGLELIAASEKCKLFLYRRN